MPLSKIHRQTRETEVNLELELDGHGRAKVDTGIPFLDHMLHLFTAHGYFEPDRHGQGRPGGGSAPHCGRYRHLPGQVFREAVTQRSRGVRRFGSARVPMDEALAQVTVDLSNRPFLHAGGRPAARRRRPGPPTAQGVLARSSASTAA